LFDRQHPRPTRIALPWWDAQQTDAHQSDTIPELPSLRWLQSRAARCLPGVQPWRDWLLESTGMAAPLAARFPAGPCVLAATGGDAQSAGLWAVAHPVHLATAIDHLRMAPTHTLAIAPDEAAALHATVQAHLASLGFGLRQEVPDLWSLSCDNTLECDTFEPADVIGRNVRAFMPRGRDGQAVCRLMNEIQMLLHEHPVNELRSRDGRPAINSLWLWGFGRAEPAPAKPLPPLVADDAWLRGLWARHGVAACGGDALEAFMIQADEGGLLALATPPASSPADALATADAGVLQALRTAVAGGLRRTLEIHTGTRILVLDARSRWRFWRRSRPLDPVSA
jgi:hypothetical protein